MPFSLISYCVPPQPSAVPLLGPSVLTVLLLASEICPCSFICWKCTFLFPPSSTSSNSSLPFRSQVNCSFEWTEKNRKDLPDPCVLVPQWDPTLGDLMDYSPLVYSVLEVLCLYPFPSPGDRPFLGTEPASPSLKADSLPSEHKGSGQPPLQTSKSRWNPKIPAFGTWSFLLAVIITTNSHSFD